MPSALLANSDQDQQLESLSWDELGRLVKRTENDIDSKLLSLGRLVSSATRSQRHGLNGAKGGSLHQAEDLSTHVELLLKKLETQVHTLRARADDDESNGSGHVLQRHVDILQEYTREFQRSYVWLIPFYLLGATKGS